MTDWLLGTQIGRYVLFGVAVVGLAALAYWRVFAKGASSERTKNMEASLERLAKAATARKKEQEHPTDEKTDKYNRDRAGR